MSEMQQFFIIFLSWFCAEWHVFFCSSLFPSFVLLFFFLLFFPIPLLRFHFPYVICFRFSVGRKKNWDAGLTEHHVFFSDIVSAYFIVSKSIALGSFAIDLDSQISLWMFRKCYQQLLTLSKFNFNSFKLHPIFFEHFWFCTTEVGFIKFEFEFECIRSKKNINVSSKGALVNNESL